jgi:ketosteroid isomerase-like protein
VPDHAAADVADVLAIHELTARYCDVVNRRAYDEVGTVFADDGVWAPPTGEHVGLPGIVDGLKGAIEPWELLIQTATNPQVSVDGDTATARWYIQEFGRSAEGDSITIVGTYDDRVVRTAAGWRFAARRFTLLFFGKHGEEGMVRPFG